MKILVIPGLTMPNVDESLLDRIREAGGPGAEVVLADSFGEALEAAGDVDVILGVINPQLFGRAHRLKWVHATTAGADAYLFDAMRNSGVALSGDKGLVGSHLADHTFALLLALTRRVARAILDAPNSWEHRVEYRREEFELEGLTMGIVGFGGTGKAIARRAAAFGMRCIAVDVEDVPPTAEVPEVWGVDRLDELLRAADVVASGLPLAPETRGLFGDHAFALMKPTAILVNVTRGEVVDGDALVRALRSGAIASRRGGRRRCARAGAALGRDRRRGARRCAAGTAAARTPAVDHPERGDDAAHGGRQPAPRGAQHGPLLPEPRALPRRRTARGSDRQDQGLLTPRTARDPRWPDSRRAARTMTRRRLDMNFTGMTRSRRSSATTSFVHDVSVIRTLWSLGTPEGHRSRRTRRVGAPIHIDPLIRTLDRYTLVELSAGAGTIAFAS